MTINRNDRSLEIPDVYFTFVSTFVMDDMLQWLNQDWYKTFPHVHMQQTYVSGHK